MTTKTPDWVYNGWKTPDNYRIPIRPAVISFSGGRSSGYMLKHILDAHGGSLPDDVFVCFANTGKERPETLDFVQRVSQEWGVHIVWLERDLDEGNTFNVVSHNSASRKGEPFEAFLNTQKLLPSPKRRTCTTDLKVRPIRWYCQRELGLKNWSGVIGYRPDEFHRVKRLYACDDEKWHEGQTQFLFQGETDPEHPWKAEAERKKRRLQKLQQEGLKPQTPMAFDLMATADGVKSWWKMQPFDLGIESWEGNCDICFLKRQGVVKRIMRLHPQLARWWIEQEKRVRAEDHPNSNLFRIDRPNYAALLQFVKANPEFDGEFLEATPDDGQECLCHD